jgi:hypothetical protein
VIHRLMLLPRRFAPGFLSSDEIRLLKPPSERNTRRSSTDYRLPTTDSHPQMNADACRFRTENRQLATDNPFTDTDLHETDADSHVTPVKSLPSTRPKAGTRVLSATEGTENTEGLVG